ncbi:unnamed protein product [Absidia cylindrospora]
MAMTQMAMPYPGSAPPPIHAPHPGMSSPYYPPHMMAPYSAPTFYPGAVPMHHRAPGPMMVSHPGYYDRGCCDCRDGCCLCTCLTGLCCALCCCEDEQCACCY